MAVGVFPIQSSDGGSNDFLLDMGDYTNNTVTFSREYPAGGYTITIDPEDSIIDFYLIAKDGSYSGYTNSSQIVATKAFDSIVILGSQPNAKMTFIYNGESGTPSNSGEEAGAGAYILGVLPSVLPNIDDTTTVSGGNFATDVEVTFIGTDLVELAAKNIVRNSSTELVVTRPDLLIQDNAPYDVKVVNPGIPVPLSSGSHILQAGITAGADPTFTSISPITGAQVGEPFSTFIQVADSDGSVVLWELESGALPGGLSLNAATGEISGTPTANGDYYFTIKITDDGNNTAAAEYNIPVGAIIEGGVVTTDSTYKYHTFSTSDDLLLKNALGLPIEYLIVAGGGGGGDRSTYMSSEVNGGGGAGGVFTTSYVTATPFETHGIAIGAGGSPNANGSDTVFGSINSALGGGSGATTSVAASVGGSGGGGAGSTSPISLGAAGTPGQGFAGGNVNGGGGGAGGVGIAGNASSNQGNGGPGAYYADWANASGFIFDGGYFGGGGGGTPGIGLGGVGGGGNGGQHLVQGSTAGDPNSGGGGGASGNVSNYATNGQPGRPGGSGLLVVRYAL